MKKPAYMEVHQHNKTACQKSGQMVFFSQAVVSFCIELFCVVTLQYQILVRIATAYFIIEKKKTAPQPWPAIAQRFCSPGSYMFISILSVGSQLIFQSRYDPNSPQFVQRFPMQTHFTLPFSLRIKPTLMLYSLVLQS